MQTMIGAMKQRLEELQEKLFSNFNLDKFKNSYPNWAPSVEVYTIAVPDT